MYRLALLFALLAIAPATAQVSALFQPISLAGAAAATGPAKEAGTWNVYVCSRETLLIALPWQRVLMAAPSIRALTPAQANKLLAVRTRQNWKAITARITSYAAAGVAIGFFPPAAAAIPALDMIRDRANAAAPVYAIDNPVPDIISLSPGACFTGTFLASKMPDVKPILVDVK